MIERFFNEMTKFMLNEKLIPGFLAVATTLGFFTTVAVMLFREVPPGSEKVVGMMLGTLGTAWIAVMTYHYGSSSGSAKKTDLMANGKKEQD